MYIYILGSSARFARAEAFGITLRDHITESYYRIIIRDDITKYGYGIILRDNITRSY